MRRGAGGTTRRRAGPRVAAAGAGRESIESFVVVLLALFL
jgi:hypothetical protein